MDIARAHRESARFGVEVLRASGHGATLAELRSAAVERGADLVIVRCDAADWQGIHVLEGMGARLMDTHLSFERGTTGTRDASDAGVSVRSARGSDVEAVAVLARDAFADYGGHFHADPRLAPRATDVYEDWLVRSLTEPDVADAVLVAEDDEGLVGVTTLQVGGETAIGVLDAVAPRAQGRGVYGRLGQARIAEARERGAGLIVVRTHLVNVGARRGLARLGFLPTAQEHTFHLWVDGQGESRRAATSSV